MRSIDQDIYGQSPTDTPTADLTKTFTQDILAGLTNSSKSLPCVYFYDGRGSRLFESICEQPEYYCTRAESEILRRYAADIAARCTDPVQIVELGSGNSIKARTLLEAFVSAQKQTTYVPIDVSTEILASSTAKMRRAFPELVVKPISARYEDALKRLDPTNGSILLVWLGSSIGNYDRPTARSFIAGLGGCLSNGDHLLLGVDLIKERPVLEAAYNDRAGVTAAFNLNLLTRINLELGGNFKLKQFYHKAIYNNVERRIEMYLVSRCRQEVKIEALDLTVAFSEGERIHTENSYKYDTEEIISLAESLSEIPPQQWFDTQKRFCLSLFEVSKVGR